MKYQKYLNQKGSLLLELIVAVMIIGLVVLVINNVPQAMKLVGVSNREGVAQQIANKTIEDLRSQSFASLSNTSSSPISDSRISQLPQGTGIYKIADCSICITNQQAKLVTVIVSWYDQSTKKNVELDTVISSGGLQ